MNYIDHNPAAQLQVAPTKKSLPKYLTLEQSIELLNRVNGDNKERDYAIITLFLKLSYAKEWGFPLFYLYLKSI